MAAKNQSSSERGRLRHRSHYEDAIRMMITQANNHLEELQTSMALAGS